jgi:hypothetical protein
MLNSILDRNFFLSEYSLRLQMALLTVPGGEARTMVSPQTILAYWIGVCNTTSIIIIISCMTPTAGHRPPPRIITTIGPAVFASSGLPWPSSDRWSSKAVYRRSAVQCVVAFSLQRLSVRLAMPVCPQLLQLSNPSTINLSSLIVLRG